MKKRTKKQTSLCVTASNLLKMETTELKQIIKNIKEMNPYPLDVFLEPSDEDWKDIGKFLAEHGKNPDRIFAKWGRMVWENCVNCMEDYLPS